MHITFNNLCKQFDHGSASTEIFTNVSFSFEQNHSYALIGPSGIGKSTLIHMIAGIDHPSSGAISLNHSNVSNLSLQERVKLLHKSISIVFQKSLLLHELSILENVMLKQIIHGSITQQHIQQAKQLLDNVGLLDKADATPNILSGGQQQKVAILRAIFQPPQFLLADEPTGNLDEASGKQIIHLLLEYKKLYNMGLIISTHDMSVAKQCDHIIKIENKMLIYS